MLDAVRNVVCFCPLCGVGTVFRRHICRQANPILEVVTLLAHRRSGNRCAVQVILSDGFLAVIGLEGNGVGVSCVVVTDGSIAVSGDDDALLTGSGEACNVTDGAGHSCFCHAIQRICCCQGIGCAGQILGVMLHLIGVHRRGPLCIQLNILSRLGLGDLIAFGQVCILIPAGKGVALANRIGRLFNFVLIAAGDGAYHTAAGGIKGNVVAVSVAVPVQL